MKKLITLAFLAFAFAASAQTPVKNGTIYKEHPYITIVKGTAAMFEKADTVALAKLYADTARFYDAADRKGYSLAKTKTGWKYIYDNWEQISIKQVGYPDGLEYTTEPFTVASWWLITIVNKKTHKTAKFEQTIYDEFNKDGKIAFEISYYDTAAIIAAMKE